MGSGVRFVPGLWRKTTSLDGGLVFEPKAAPPYAFNLNADSTEGSALLGRNSMNTPPSLKIELGIPQSESGVRYERT